jgi:hypothetical protein
VIVVAAGAIVGTLVVTRSNQEDIFLEGANTVGRNPFTMVAAVTPTTATTTTTATTAATTTTLIPPPGGTTTTALFGGSGSQKYCDPEALIAFLMSHPDKAAAWVEGLNADPTLQWSGGNQLTVNDIPTYIHELTPTFLAVDTRVTNHSYVNGHAVPHQSVLQAGTAVLVDKFGIPRARCACGNPLIPPKKVRNPHYHGDCWLDDTTTTTRRRRPTTTTSSSTSLSSTSTSTLSSTSTTGRITAEQPAAARLDGDSIQLILGRPSHRCGSDAYCSPPGCDVTTTVPETTTSLPTTTTEGATTTTCVPGIVAGAGCVTPTTSRARVSGGTTPKTTPPTTPPTVTIKPAPSTTRRTVITPTTIRRGGNTTSPPVTGKP